MNDVQEAKLSMYLGVKDFLAASSSVITALPSFSTFLTTFTGAVDQIQAIRTQQEEDKTGLTVSKSMLRNDLVIQSVDLARKLTALATVTNNAVLMAQVNYSYSDLSGSADTILRDRALLLHQKGVLNLVALAPYGVTAAILATLSTSITAYNAAIPKPRAGITERRQTTGKIKELFGTADKTLRDKMDPLIEILRLTNPDFYLSYRASRSITNEHPTRKIAFKGKVKDKSSRQPLGKVIITVSTVSKPKKSTAKGNFQYKLLAAGTYTVTFTKHGYHSQQYTVYINDGETTKLNVELMPVALDVSVPAA
jgi:hypothetical protein